MKIAFLYAGQGSQKVGMGKDLYDKNEIFRSVIDSINIDFSVKDMMFYGDEKVLSDTRFTQPCLAAFAMGVTEVLRKSDIEPSYSAGLSLGEYCALYSAGVFDGKTLMDTVNFRGKVMKESTGNMQFRMSAIMGLDRQILLEICNDTMQSFVNMGTEDQYVTISNYNCPGQYVICGTEEAAKEAEERATKRGAKRCIPLKVSGPFHTRYMKMAGDKLDMYFRNIKFEEMKFPVIFNTTARPIDKGQKISDILVQQVQNSIYMEDIITYLEKCGVDTIIEIGPGRALSGFVKRTTKMINAYAIEDYDSLNKIVKMIKEGH